MRFLCLHLVPFWLLETIGRYVINVIFNVGHSFIFFVKFVYNCFVPPYYYGVILKQFIEIFFFSLPIVGITAIFTGAVLILQNSLIIHNNVSGDFVSGVVVVAIVRELGPVLIGLIIAGRVGAAIAAEIGTMRITEQIDALFTLDTNPFKYLVVPRIISAMVAMPILILCADLIGAYGGYIVGSYQLGYTSEMYIKGVIKFLHAKDVTLGLVKATVFGFIISFMGCYSGYYCSGGARGVGLATTYVVVVSSMFIILFNYIITVFYS
ncbi:permease family protein [Ehrlichia chaffeensis str. Heartland]|uniref:MlaE family ABC transporter permease n=1 Tax=Ehrlichia chaffeensis TaxID=945 RepID=UPI000444EA49|nr:ABC transporter permease [Ehrlichia chaffeensis]AHX04105.1 permease family protein [Ehrlichia chaffeensis str. Heartland]AHX06041.1 permease family protein [Ehrlichia chaffeensis str. Jax]AHX10105.1 permease family protein [Ehrlichia chaffeensis str. West Paces]